jgi:DNA-binding GntR family transcriptional regulator
MPRLAVVSMVDAVSDDLRARLFRGELLGGAPVTEADVSGHYDIARPTAKAAIEQLVAEGLLDRSAHKTARVPVLEVDSIRDIYGTRMHLEGEALRRLAGLRVVPDPVRTANADVVAAGAHGSLEIIEPDMRFHSALVDALDSPRLSRMYGSLVNEVRLCMAQVQGRGLLTVDLIAREHEHILRLVAAGDADGAVEALHAHLERARDLLSAALVAPEHR